VTSAIDRRAFITGVGCALVTAPVSAGAQAGKVYRIGYLAGGSSDTSRYTIEAFRQGLRELGWVEGQNIVIDYRFGEGSLDRLPDLAAELVRLKVNVVVAAPSPPAAAARKATATIPIVMIGGGDPVGQGLIASLARPGGNVTGLAYFVGQGIFGKQLALLKEAVPKVRRVAVLWNPAIPTLAPVIGEVKVAAQSLGLQLQPFEARGPSDFDRAFAAMARQRTEALLVITDSTFTTHRTRLADLAIKGRLPSAYTNRQPVDAGGLMSYGPSFADLWRRAAGYVDKILKGAKPADLPVEQPTKFELVINLKTARALGLMLPPSLLGRADEVIQ
jgi:ABC-type uncharacterized transport system substrate-binding protein